MIFSTGKGWNQFVFRWIPSPSQHHPPPAPSDELLHRDNRFQNIAFAAVAAGIICCLRQFTANSLTLVFASRFDHTLFTFSIRIATWRRSWWSRGSSVNLQATVIRSIRLAAFLNPGKAISRRNWLSWLSPPLPRLCTVRFSVAGAFLTSSIRWDVPGRGNVGRVCSIWDSRINCKVGLTACRPTQLASFIYYRCFCCHSAGGPICQVVQVGCVWESWQPW